MKVSKAEEIVQDWERRMFPGGKCSTHFAFLVQLAKEGLAIGRLAGLEEAEDVLFHIAYSVKSCRAGDGDDRSWQECAEYCENLAENKRDEILALAGKGEKNDN